jgi:hypothetical protein
VLIAYEIDVLKYLPFTTVITSYSEGVGYCLGVKAGQDSDKTADDR